MRSRKPEVLTLVQPDPNTSGPEPQHTKPLLRPKAYRLHASELSSVRKYSESLHCVRASFLLRAVEQRATLHSFGRIPVPATLRFRRSQTTASMFGVVGYPEPQTLNPTLNPKPQTLNAKPHPKPQTLKPTTSEPIVWGANGAGGGGWT